MDQQQTDMPEEHEHDTVHTAESSSSEYTKFAGVILGIVVFSSLLFLLFDGQSLTSWIQLFMATFFIVFAGFKFAGYEDFIELFPQYDIIAAKHRAYAYAYPFIEIFLGFAYLFNALGNIRDSITLIVMSVSAVGVWREIQKRRSGVYCACLGNVIKLPLTTISLTENVAMAVMALAMLIMA